MQQLIPSSWNGKTENCLYPPFLGTVIIARRYYSAPHNNLDGRDESRAVFLAGNALPERWQQQKDFSIAELGFGTGLNFAETAQNWKQTGPTGATLTYTAFELYPLTSDQINTALSPWPDLQKLAYRMLSTSPHTLKTLYKTGYSQSKYIFQGDRTLILKMATGDANSLLPDWNKENSTKADVWYLDGFSPAKNPQLWNPSLMQAVYEATAAGGTFSTYTSAGHTYPLN